MFLIPAAYYQQRHAEEQIAHWDRNFAMIDGGVFSAEDLFISEQIQIGAASGANDTFVFGRQEHHLRRFHENVRAMIEGSDQERPGAENRHRFPAL